MVVQVADLMTRDITAVDQAETVMDAARRMAEEGRGSLIVLDRGNPVGIVTERDLVRRIVAENRDPTQVKVGDIMSMPLITINVEATVYEAALLMVQNKIRRLAVLERERLVGVITATDLVKFLKTYIGGAATFVKAIRREP